MVTSYKHLQALICRNSWEDSILCWTSQSGVNIAKAHFRNCEWYSQLCWLLLIHTSVSHSHRAINWGLCRPASKCRELWLVGLMSHSDCLLLYFQCQLMANSQSGFGILSISHLSDQNEMTVSMVRPVTLRKCYLNFCPAIQRWKASKIFV